MKLQHRSQGSCESDRNPGAKMPEPLEQQAVVVAGTGEDGVDAITVAPLEEVSTEAAVGLGVGR